MIFASACRKVKRRSLVARSTQCAWESIRRSVCALNRAEMWLFDQRLQCMASRAGHAPALPSRYSAARVSVPGRKACSACSSAGHQELAVVLWSLCSRSTMTGVAQKSTSVSRRRRRRPATRRMAITTPWGARNTIHGSAESRITKRRTTHSYTGGRSAWTRVSWRESDRHCQQHQSIKERKYRPILPSKAKIIKNQTVWRLLAIPNIVILLSTEINTVHVLHGFLLLRIRNAVLPFQK